MIEKCGLDKDTAAQGDIYKDGDEKRQYVSWGNNKKKSELQKLPMYASGTETITGGGGDVTITVPFDWTGGYLVVDVSDTEAQYFDGTDRAIAKYSTSYNALTNTTYTSLELYADKVNSGSSGRSASENLNGNPVSATTTSFTINDCGTTQYIKWFIWA